MAQDIRLFKLVTGEIVIGKYDAEKDVLHEVATLQSVPAQQGGVQMMLLPYGIPFENTLCGTLEGKHFLYRYTETPQEIKDKYLEVSINISTNGGLGKLQFGQPAAKSNLIK